MIAECLLRREETTTIITEPLANLPVLRYFVSQPIMLPRKTLRASESAGERRTRFGFVSFEVDFEGVLACETTRAAWDGARESSALIVLLLLVVITVSTACGRGFPGAI